MSGAVREEIVDEHAEDGEQEDDERPEDLVGCGAVGLEDLDWWDISTWLTDFCARVEGNILKTMISRTRTISPIIPPPVPYCHELPWPAAATCSTGAASARAAQRS